MISKELTIEILIHPDDVSHHESLSFEQCGCDHSESIAAIDKKLAEGDLWAWCCVEVKVSKYGLSVSSYMGGSSYIDEEDFKKGGYYEQMLGDATDELNADILEIVMSETNV